MSITDVEAPLNDAHALSSEMMNPPEAEPVARQEEPISPSTAAAEIASDIQNTPLVDPTQEVPNVKTNLCGVCNEKVSKYKCSRCYLPYCSLSCSTLHKSAHPVDEPRPTAPPPVVEPSLTPVPAPRAGTAAAAGYRGPFAVLDDSRELQQLFAQFPNLPAQLEAINCATLPPVDEGFGRQQQQHGGRKQPPWNQDRGLQLGVEALKEARRTYGKDGEGVREYGRLVLQLLERGDDGVAKQLIQRELDDESTQLIRQLLEMEG